MDLSATHHITPNSYTIYNPMPYNGGEQVTIGNGKKISITHIGTSFLPFSHKPLLLHNNVLHTDAISKGLISIAHLCKDNKAFVKFYSSFFLVKDLRSKMVLL